MLADGISWAELTPGQVALAYGFGLLMWLVLTLFTIKAVIASAALPPPVTLVVALTVVVLVAMAAFVVTRNGDLITLASLGLGALAGAVSATWQNRIRGGNPDDQREGDVRNPANTPTKETPKDG